jgi:glycosyltransferase involved in cell wall biosynthesis
MTIAAIIPCYRVRRHILGVIEGALDHVDAIYVVDDQCPENTGDFVKAEISHRKLRVIQSPENQGVGGATMAGYQAALADGHEILVKLDGDGQMDASEIPFLVRPILSGAADYAKGNRFFNPREVRAMPKARLLGNAGLSFLTKLSSGYWTIFDPTNGFTALHARVAERLPFDLIARRYFFESDLLFRLGTLRACVVDVPMPARYGDEVSNMDPGKMVAPFFAANLRNFTKRVFYNYFLRDFSVASIFLVAAFGLAATGLFLGVSFWLHGIATDTPATSGKVMLAALPLILSTQLLLAFLGYDVESTPRTAIHALLPPLGQRAAPTPRIAASRG